MSSRGRRTLVNVGYESLAGVYGQADSIGKHTDHVVVVVGCLVGWVISVLISFVDH